MGERATRCCGAAGYFAEMLELTGDAGAKPLMARHEAQLIEVEVATDSIFHDVDAPEDLARIRQAGTAG